MKCGPSPRGRDAGAWLHVSVLQGEGAPEECVVPGRSGGPLGLPEPEATAWAVKHGHFRSLSPAVRTCQVTCQEGWLLVSPPPLFVGGCHFVCPHGPFLCCVCMRRERDLWYLFLFF